MDPALAIQQIVVTAHEVRRALRGRDLAAGLERALLPALAVRGVACSADHREPIEYRGGGLTVGYHVDLHIADCPLVVELKVLDNLHAADDDQMLNRLRLGAWQRGAVNLNVTVSNRGVQAQTFDLRHLARPAPAARPVVKPRQPASTGRMPWVATGQLRRAA
jgi:GxxExxY protein